jgi:O-antigen/teichoic acid export membrane protein
MAVVDKGLKGKALRGSAWTIVGYGGSQVLRLLSNLVLTRLLVPEAFGLMALVTVFIQGLTMFTDIGIGPSIIQNKRGDDSEFLNTAWTIQVIRGVFLWLGSCALAYPVSLIYNQSSLLYLLPVVGLTAIISGFSPTKVYTANRNLALARLTGIDLGSQILSLAVTVGFVFAYNNVWALVVGYVMGTFIKLALSHVAIAGPPNRFHWDTSASHELIHFGKWLFFTSICGFVIDQVDKIILGHSLTAAELGVYGIGSLMGLVPLLMTIAVSSKVLLPIYRTKVPARELADRNSIFKAKAIINLGFLGMSSLLVLGGPMIISLLYDDRYAEAGGITSLVCACSFARHLCVINDCAFLAIGKSRTFGLIMFVSAITQLATTLIGVTYWGLGGVVLATGIGPAVGYLLIISQIRHLGIWFMRWDALMVSLNVAMCWFGFWLHGDAIRDLFGP